MSSGRGLPFVKLHGCANDFVLIDAFEGAPPAARDAAALAGLAKRVCDRRRGIGADGLLVVRPPQRSGAHARMAMFNPDGSESERCGNGLRCFGKFLFDRGRAPRNMRIETCDSLLALAVDELDAAGKASELTVSIGVPDFARARVPMAGAPDEPALDEPFLIAGRTLRVSALSLGNPHCVVFVDDVATFPVHSLGPAIERDARFPERVNVEFVRIAAKNELEQRTWERGAGETEACGSGATAAAVVACKLHGFGPRVRVRLRGGELTILWNGEGQEARLRGPAVEVFEGVIEGELERSSMNRPTGR